MNLYKSTTLTWAERIERARKNNRHFTQEDHELVKQWHTCAVGEKLGLTKDRMPYKDDYPTYEEGKLYLNIKGLGHAFEACVDWDDPDGAYRNLCEIAREARTILDREKDYANREKITHD